MKKAFFADMGGFVFQKRIGPWTPNNSLIWYQKDICYTRKSTWQSWTTKISRMVFHSISVTTPFFLSFLGANCKDRLITVVQVLIFSITSITCIARAVQHLAIATLELTTLAFVFSMIVTSVMWKSKPQDVGAPVILYTEVTIAEILKRVS
jgi:hypothetical protein